MQYSYFAPRVEVGEEILVDGVVPKETIQLRINEFQPDFILSLKSTSLFDSKIPNYLAITYTLNDFKNFTYGKGKNILNVDGFLYASEKIIEPIKEHFQKSKIRFYGIEWYPSCCLSKFYEVNPTQLFYCGFQSDPKRNGHLYRKMFALLDQTDYFRVYGPPDRWEFTPNSRQGLLPFNGGKSINDAIQKAGITLILHADDHLRMGAPSSRIFEAASAGSVIICDRNAFVVREFKDSVLYVDVENKSAEDIYSQINACMDWILNNPEEAKKMARQAHTIFNKKFSLEFHLLNLAKMHEKIMAERKR